MALPSEWSQWEETKTSAAPVDTPSDWTPWETTLTWDETKIVPSMWTPWQTVTTSPPLTAGFRLTLDGWKQLGGTLRRGASGVWSSVALNAGVTTSTPADPDPTPTIAWGHNDRIPRVGYETSWEGFEQNMRDVVSYSDPQPIATFLRGYSGFDFPATFQATTVSAAPSMNLGAMLNVKRPDYQALANGDYDATIVSFFNSWPVETFGSFTINHEPENDGPRPARETNPDYHAWASVQGPLWSQGIARTIAVAAPIIRARGLDVKLGGCLMDFSWDSDRWMYFNWWDYTDPQYFDVVEFQVDAYSKTHAGPPPYYEDLIPRLVESFAPAKAVGISSYSIFETANDRRMHNGGDTMVGTDETVAQFWEDFPGALASAIPETRMVCYFSIPDGPASAEAGIMGRGLGIFANICLNGRRP